jgi:hypothetical protein
MARIIPVNYAALKAVLKEIVLGQLIGCGTSIHEWWDIH